MMNKEQFKKLMKSLKSVETKLDILVRLHRASMPKPKITAEERNILKFCDKKHSLDEIVNETKKTRGSIKMVLTRLRKKALIRSVKLKDKIVYERI